MNDQYYSAHIHQFIPDPFATRNEFYEAVYRYRMFGEIPSGINPEIWSVLNEDFGIWGDVLARAVRDLTKSLSRRLGE